MVRNSIGTKCIRGTDNIKIVDDNKQVRMLQKNYTKKKNDEDKKSKIKILKKIERERGKTEKWLKIIQT